MRRFAAASVAVTLFVLAACGGGGDGDGAPLPTGAAADDAVLLQGRDVWITNCVRCHGATGGGGVGPQLSGGRVVDRYPDVEDELVIVRSGKGVMPAWENQLSPAEIDAVVRYTREVL